MQTPRVSIEGIKALGAVTQRADHSPHEYGQGHPAPTTPRGKTPRGNDRDPRSGLFGHWLGKFVFHTTPHRTGIEAQFAIFNQARTIMPLLFCESMESMLVAGGMSDWEWQALHWMIVRLMTFSQKARIKMARMDFKDEQELADVLEGIETPLADYLLRLKTAHEQDRNNERE